MFCNGFELMSSAERGVDCVAGDPCFGFNEEAQGQHLELLLTSFLTSSFLPSLTPPYLLLNSFLPPKAAASLSLDECAVATLTRVLPIDVPFGSPSRWKHGEPMHSHFLEES